jgi:two-component system nitrate/nitrite response regulator NarL
MRNQPKILLVSRRDLGSEALSAILSDYGFDIGVYDPATDLDLASILSLTAYQIALVDARVADPLADLASLNALSPAIKMALLADSAPADLVRRAFAAGAIGVVDRSASCAVLVCQLELLALGGCVIPSRFIEALTKQQRSASASLMEAAAKALSVREREIVQCLATGMPNKVIARELHLSEPTVKVHVGAVLRKLNLANRTKVAVWAACLGATLAPQP